MAQLRRHPG